MHVFELQAAIFDLDGVITRTADVHAAAWKATLDPLLITLGIAEPFDAVRDYLSFVDGKPRYDGIRSFLASRKVLLPDGTPDDAPGSATVYGIGKQKDGLFRACLERDGIHVYPSSVALVEALRSRGVKTTVVTSSRNGRLILRRAGIAGLFDAVIDGRDLDEGGMRGKPAPDAFLKCAKLIDVTPSHVAVFEDAVSGVDAARRGGFGLVVGVDRGGHAAALRANGADIVVADLDALDPDRLDEALHERREHEAWRVDQHGFDPAREHAMESLFTVGNGYVGVRGSPDTLLPGSQGDLFVAGVYDRKHAARPYSEEEFLNIGGGDSLHAELVSAPFPFRVALSVDGVSLDPSNERTRSYHRRLDLKRATVNTEAVFEFASDHHVTIASTRCASAADPHLLLQTATVTVGDQAADVAIDASLHDPDLGANHPHLTVLESGSAPGGIEFVRYGTKASGYELCIASRVRYNDGDMHQWRGGLDAHGRITLRRYVVVYTSRDTDDPLGAALRNLDTRDWQRFDDAFDGHASRWLDRWASADISVGGSYATEQALRFNNYHLHSTAGTKPYASVGARALSGRAYEGHIFWDVEIFMLPFYVHTAPELALNALRYRHHTLDGARQRARACGCAGANFAWESTVTGEDVTPDRIRLKTTGREIPIFTGAQQIHVTADIAYGVWRYWDATHDHAFMREAGVELLAETARYWVTRCERGPTYHHIRGVVGPDEYHHGVDDNAYTNWMARFNLERAAAAAAWLQRDTPDTWSALRERIALQRDEPAEWAATAASLFCPGPDARGVIEQFDGFFDLEDYSLAAGERLQAPINRLFDWDKINRLKLIKQADTLMLPFLFPERFTREQLAANYRYYEPLTDHGSSLSPAIHGALAARLGLADDAWRYWRQSLWLDLSNAMTNSALGVHPACMGGTWQALVFGFLDVRFGDDGPTWADDAASRLPASWRSLAMSLRWRGTDYPVEVKR